MHPTTRIMLLILAVVTLYCLLGCTSYQRGADGSQSLRTGANLTGDAEIVVDRDGLRMSADEINHTDSMREVRRGVLGGVRAATGGGVAGELLGGVVGNE